MTTTLWNRFRKFVDVFFPSDRRNVRFRPRTFRKEKNDCRSCRHDRDNVSRYVPHYSRGEWHGLSNTVWTTRRSSERGARRVRERGIRRRERPDPCAHRDRARAARRDNPDVSCRFIRATRYRGDNARRTCDVADPVRTGHLIFYCRRSPSRTAW